MNEENKKKKTTSSKKTSSPKKEVSTEKKVSKASTKITKDATKKAPAKKTATKKVTEENKEKTVKKSTGKTATKKSSSAPKVEVKTKAQSNKKTSTTTKKKTTTKKVPKKIENNVVEEVVKNTEIKEETQKPLIEIKKEIKEEQTEEYVVTNIKKNDQIELKIPNYKVIILLLLFIIFLFICGVVYIMDYSKKIGSNNKVNRENVTYTLDDYESKDNSSSQEQTVAYKNVEKITIYDYEKKLKKNEKMIVLVASKYCGGCKAYEPILNTVLGEKKLKAYKIDVAEFETDKEKELFDSLLKITGTPTTFLIENGKAVASITSSTDKETLSTWLDKNYEV